MVCDVFDINRSCYYDHCDRCKRVDVERLELRAKVNQKFKLSRRSAGSRTIKTMLNDDGIEIGRFKVRRLMAEIGLICKQPGPHAYKQAIVERPDIRNILDRQFDEDDVNQVWCGDITYGAPSLRKLLWKMLSGLEHVWNASRTTLEETNWMPALCYGRA